MCYSFYLIHWPIVKALSQAFYRIGIQSEWLTLVFTIPVTVFVSACVAWGFHVAIERRFMNTLPLTARREKALIAGETIPCPSAAKVVGLNRTIE